MRRISWPALLLLLAAPTVADELPYVQGRSVKNDLSPPVRDLLRDAPAPPTGLSVEIPIGEPQSPSYVRRQQPGATEPEPDVPAPSAPGGTLTPTVALSFEGLNEDENASTVGARIVPPDTNGDIGLDGEGNKIYIQYINLIWGIYDAATGTRISGPTAGNSFWSGFGGECETNNDGDPIVLYDDDAGRWVFAQFVTNRGRMCFAISQTSDPLGPYHRYEFVVASQFGTPDYPKVGVWAQGPPGAGQSQSSYTLTTRNFPFSPAAFSHSIVLDRDTMLAGAAANFISFGHQCIGNDCVEGQLPPHQAGPPPPFGTCPTFLAMVDEQYDDSPESSDGIRLHQVCPNWGGTATITETFAASATGFSRALGNGFSDCIDAIPTGGEALDCLAAFSMFRAQYRWFDGSDGQGTHASVVLNTTVNAGSDRGGIHWLELRSADGQTGWSVFQEGTYAPADSRERWMGSIAQDGARNIALGYSRTSTSEFPSLYYTMRDADDAAGTMGSEEVCHDATGAQTASSNRWGDYSSMSADPVDDCTFWFTSEYYETTTSFDFKTRICSFTAPDCGDDTPEVEITMPADGAEFDTSTSIMFAGTATDTEDGDLSSSLAWSSNVDGSIGSGDFSSTLSAGLHTIVASVTDSGGNTGSDQIDLTITGPDCPADDTVGPGTISGAETHRALNSLTVLDGTTVDSTGQLSLIAGDSIGFENGFELYSGGMMEVSNTSEPCL